MKKLALSIVLLFLAICTQAQNKATPSDDISKAKGIVVSPARLMFEVDKGGTSKKSVMVKNLTGNKQRLIVELMDWTRDTLGEHNYFAPGTNSYSCAQWVTFDKPIVELEPGQSVDVTVTLSLPDNADAVSEMRWCMLIFRSLQDKYVPSGNLPKTSAQIEKNLGMGVHIYEVPPTLSTKELKMISFGPLPGKKNTYRIVAKNVGALQVYGKFSVELSSASGQKTALESQVVPLFPNQDRYVDFEVPANVPKGKYTAVALIDAGDDDVPIEAAQKEITIQ